MKIADKGDIEGGFKAFLLYEASLWFESSRLATLQLKQSWVCKCKKWFSKGANSFKDKTKSTMSYLYSQLIRSSFKLKLTAEFKIKIKFVQ